MSHGTKFTESQLKQFGFCEIAPGQWGKDDSENKPARSSALIVESNSRRKTKGSAKKKAARKKGTPDGSRFRLVITSYRTTLIDPSNPYYKAIEDTLTNNGIFPDDGPAFCDQPIFIQHKVPKGLERTEIEVLQIPS